MKAKKFICIACSLILLVSLAACTSPASPGGSASGAPSKGGKVNITYWKGPNSDVEADLWKPAVEKFQKENPGITVEFLVTPWDTWKEKYTAAFASGSPPDVSYMNEWYPAFADAGQLLDLSDRVTDELRGSYSKAAWDVCTFNGKVAGIPYILGDSILFYNKDLFSEAGITQLPQTWDELRDAAKKLTKDTNNDGKPEQWGIRFGMTPAINIHQFLPFVLSAGATYLNSDNTAMNFNNAQGVEGMSYVTGLILNDKVAPPIDMYNRDQLDDMFAKGKIAMTIDQIEFAMTAKSINPDLNLGAFLMPKGPASDETAARANYGYVEMLSIAKDSKHVEESWKFIDFLNKPENGKIYIESAGLLSPNDAINQQMYQGNEIMDTAKEAAKYMVDYPLIVKWPECDTAFKEMIESILRGAAPVEKALADVDSKVSDILKE